MFFLYALKTALELCRSTSSITSYFSALIDLQFSSFHLHYVCGQRIIIGSASSDIHVTPLMPGDVFPPRVFNNINIYIFKCFLLFICIRAETVRFKLQNLYWTISYHWLQSHTHTGKIYNMPYVDKGKKKKKTSVPAKHLMHAWEEFCHQSLIHSSSLSWIPSDHVWRLNRWWCAGTRDFCIKQRFHLKCPNMFET